MATALARWSPPLPSPQYNVLACMPKGALFMLSISSALLTVAHATSLQCNLESAAEEVADVSKPQGSVQLPSRGHIGETLPLELENSVEDLGGGLPSRGQALIQAEHCIRSSSVESENFVEDLENNRKPRGSAMLQLARDRTIHSKLDSLANSHESPMDTTNSTCNMQCYLARYSDLQASFGGDHARAWDHYVSYGRQEGRDCTCSTLPESTNQPNSWHERGLHSVVGRNGVLMIGLKGSMKRWNHTASKLIQNAWINPTFFIGTNGKNSDTPQEDLDSACANYCNLMDHAHGRNFAALAHSHMRALRAAEQRTESDWTAIFEDDAVPAFAREGTETAEKWVEAFESVWLQLPKQAKFVRLGRCHPYLLADPPSKTGFRVHSHADPANPQPFQVTQLTGTRRTNIAKAFGGCTHAYMVHKDIIPQILSIFPCRFALDGCFAVNLFAKDIGKRFWGLDFMFNLDTDRTPDDLFREAQSGTGKLAMYNSLLQFGIIKQDWEVFPDGETMIAREIEARLRKRQLFLYFGEANKRDRKGKSISHETGSDSLSGNLNMEASSAAVSTAGGDFGAAVTPGLLPQEQEEKAAPVWEDWPSSHQSRGAGQLDLSR